LRQIHVVRDVEQGERSRGDGSARRSAELKKSYLTASIRYRFGVSVSYAGLHKRRTAVTLKRGERVDEERGSNPRAYRWSTAEQHPSFLPPCTVLLPTIDVFGTSVFNASSDRSVSTTTWICRKSVMFRARNAAIRVRQGCSKEATSVEDVSGRCIASEDELLTLPKG
jgi:hypothetical protein